MQRQHFRQAPAPFSMPVMLSRACMTGITGACPCRGSWACDIPLAMARVDATGPKDAHLCHRIVVCHNLVPQLAVGLPAAPRLPGRSGLSGPLAGAARRRSTHAINLFAVAPELSHLRPQILVLTELLRVRTSACSMAERVHGALNLLW